MRNMFESSLKLQETGQLMMPAEAVITQLYKHQMCALAWMANRENSEKFGVPGGILADDMGLGKTLTILSLVMTNFHDKRPLAKPDCSGIYSRAKNLSNSVLRYMPGQFSNFKSATRLLRPTNNKTEPVVGAKLGDNKRKILASAFEHTVPKRRKDNKQKVKSSTNNGYKTNGNNSSQKSVSAFDLLPSPNASEDDEKDEFDSMCFNSASTLTERIFGSNSNVSLLEKPEQHFYDGLSDDDEYQNMTEIERNERLKPKVENINPNSVKKFKNNLNVDGLLNIDSSDDEDFVSTTTRNKTKSRNRISSDDEQEIAPMLSSNNRRKSNELPDLDDSLNIKGGAKNGESFNLNRKKESNASANKHPGRKSISTLGKYIISTNKVDYL